MMSSRAGEVQHRQTRFTEIFDAQHGMQTARWLWLVVTIGGMAAFLLALPGLVGQVEHPDPAVLAELARAGISVGFYSALYIGVEFVLLVSYISVAGILFTRKPDDWMALFVAFFLVTFSLSTPLVSQAQGILPPLVLVFVTAMNTFAWFSLNALFLLFPDWRFAPRWAWIPLVALSVLILFVSLPDSSPLSLSHLPGWVLGGVYVLSWGFGIYAQVYRYRRVSTPTQRQQTKWVVYGLAMAVMLNLLISLPGIIQPSLAQEGSLYGIFTGGPIAGLPLLLIPISMGVAVMRYRLWDIDPLINRTLVYGLLTALIAGLYVLAVTILGLIFEEQSNWLVSLLTTALIAALFQPLREQLQRWINHLMYGERDDPYTVLSRLGGRLEAALTPETVLPGIVETIAHSLKLPYVAAALRGPEGELQPAAVYPPGAEEGQPAAGPDTLRLPLVYQQEVVGELRLSPRAPGEAFSQQDLRLLADLARQVGIAAHAVRLTADLRRLTVDLQRSRERLVLAREEERRRIRRDLHDGLGPSLAALALSASSVADLIATHPQSAAKMAHEMQQEIRASIADIRRLVYELRPPALDELGLVAAIRDRAAQVEVTGSTGEGLSVTVDAPDPLTDLPAAVEVAAYRIVLEGLTNVVRHACARTCVIRLDQTADMLEIEVSDDGVGLPEGYHSGVGLLSMRERAAELGGTCEVTSTPGAGTHVRAKIPL